MIKEEMTVELKKYIKKKKLEMELENIQKEIDELFYDFVSGSKTLDNSGINNNLTENIRIKCKIYDNIKSQLKKL